MRTVARSTDDANERRTPWSRCVAPFDVEQFDVEQFDVEQFDVEQFDGSIDDDPSRPARRFAPTA